MTETRINKDLVSHVEIKDVYEGYEFYGKIIKFVWLEAEYTSIFGFFRQTLYEAGFYQKGYKRNSFSWRLPNIPEGCYTLLGELYSSSYVSIFAGEKKIKTIYFDTLKESQEWCNENLPNVNLILK